MSLPANTVLLLIDVQQGLDNADYYGDRNNPHAEQNMAQLLAAWRTRGLPIYHVQHHSTEPNSPLRPESPGVAIKPEVAPQDDEPVFTKNVNSAFIGTDLEQQLRDAEIDTLVVVGLTTEHCVSTSVRMAANFGFNVYLAADGTAANSATGYDGQQFTAQQVHDAQLAALHGEFATVMPTASILTMLPE
ncbi:MAG: cysteine hydrolase family protein [Chloroflexota bacterium]